MSILLISLFVCFGVWAKTLDQKQEELKKIYEAGGITKFEYKKAQDFLKSSAEKNIARLESDGMEHQAAHLKGIEEYAIECSIVKVLSAKRASKFLELIPHTSD